MPSSQTPLQALTDLAARLAGAADLDAAMPEVLRRASAALGARSCAVWWIDDDGSIACRWGADEGDGATLARWLDAVRARGEQTVADAADGGDTTVTPIRSCGAVVAALVVHGIAPNDGSDRLWPGAVADIVGPTLAHADQAARLSSEVAARAEEVETQRRFIECVVDSLPMGLYVVDREYRIQLWNRKRETETQGLTREAALGQRVFDVLTRQDAELMRREFDEVLSTGRLQQLQLESRSTGELRTYRLTKIPMRMNGRAPSHVITVGEDITEWKAAMERTSQAEKMAAVGQLAAGVMHEINNPLATIAACAETMTLGIAELPPSRPAPPGFGEYLRIIDHEVHRCRGIIDTLLDFSRAKPVQRVRLGANAVVEQTLFLLKHHTRFKRYLVRLELADGTGPEVTVDPDKLIQVFMALLLNAADAIGEPSSDDDARGITLRTGCIGDEAFIDVSDDGQGIPREDLSKIFEPFYTTKPPGAGTGLGLAICYGIVRDHGGRIEVTSTVGVGSTFRVMLPAAS